MRHVNTLLELSHGQLQTRTSKKCNTNFNLLLSNHKQREHTDTSFTSSLEEYRTDNPSVVQKWHSSTCIICNYTNTIRRLADALSVKRNVIPSAGWDAACLFHLLVQLFVVCVDHDLFVVGLIDVTCCQWTWCEPKPILTWTIDSVYHHADSCYISLHYLHE